MPNAAAPLVSKLALADAQPAWKVGLDGRMDWGPGGAVAPDTNLYRSGAANLALTGGMSISGNLLVGGVGILYLGGSFDAILARDAANVVRTDGSFKINGTALYFGAAGDTNLYRSAADILATDDAFSITRPLANNFSLISTIVSGPMAFGIRTGGRLDWSDGIGGALDTTLYRSAAGDLRTDSTFRAGATGTQMITLGSGTPTAAPVIYFGNALDTVLYRQGVAQLRTNGMLLADGLIYAGFGATGQVIVGDTGTGINGLRFGSAADTVLYRNAAAWLHTNSQLSAAGYLLAGNALATQVMIGDTGSGFARIVFHNSQDTSLYRNAAGELRTDGTLRIGANTVFSGNGVQGGANMDFRGTQDVYVTTDNMASAVSLRDLSGNSLRLKNAQVEITSIALAKIVFNTDVNLYRSAAGKLKTDGSFDVVNGVSVLPAATAIAGYGYYPTAIAAGQYALLSTVIGEANHRFRIDPVGTQQWGVGGATAVDTSLYRAAAGELRTDGIFKAGTWVYANTGGVNQVVIGFSGVAGGGMTFGSATDTNLYRSAADTLKTDDAFIAAGDVSVLAATADANPQIKLARNYNGAGLPGIVFGPGGASALDVVMFRSAVGTLQINSALNVNNSLRVDLTGTASKLYFGATDTVANLYRLSATNLKSDGSIHAAQSFVVDHAGAASGTNRIYFGATQDASIYRSGTQALSISALGLTIGGGTTPPAWTAGTAALALALSGTAPATSANFGQLFVDASGRLNYKGSAGTVTVLAPA